MIQYSRGETNHIPNPNPHPNPNQGPLTLIPWWSKSLAGGLPRLSKSWVGLVPKTPPGLMVCLLDGSHCIVLGTFMVTHEILTDKAK